MSGGEWWRLKHLSVILVVSMVGVAGDFVIHEIN